PASMTPALLIVRLTRTTSRSATTTDASACTTDTPRSPSSGRNPIAVRHKVVERVTQDDQRRPLAVNRLQQRLDQRLALLLRLHVYELVQRGIHRRFVKAHVVAAARGVVVRTRLVFAL